jgi:hypothetical protein
MDFIPEESAVNTDAIEVDRDTLDMLKSINMGNLPGVTAPQVRMRARGGEPVAAVRPPMRSSRGASCRLAAAGGGCYLQAGSPRLRRVSQTLGGSQGCSRAAGIAGRGALGLQPGRTAHAPHAGRRSRHLAPSWSSRTPALHPPGWPLLPRSRIQRP